MLNFLKEYWFLITFLLAQIGFLISFYKRVKQSAIDTKEATKCSLRNDILEIYDRCKEDKKITGSTSYERTRFLVKNFYETYKKEILESRKYGNLEMHMFPASEYDLSDDKIYYIYNRKGKKQDFKIDIELKEKLDKIMRL